MSKKVLVLSGSPRKGGNSDILCDEFMRGFSSAIRKSASAMPVMPVAKAASAC